MKIRLFLALAITLGSAAAQDKQNPAAAAAEPAAKPAAAEPAPTPTPAPGPAPMDKVSYFIGNNMGGQFAGQGIKVDIEAFVAGMKDALDGKQPKYTREELMAAMQAFEAEMQAHAAKAGDNAKAEGEKFLAANGKRKEVTTTASGLQYEVLKEGKGAKPAATDKVKVHYHGTLISGTVFDSSVDRGEPIEFPVQGVIRGWVEALQLMPVGSKWKLFIPSNLAYGESGAGGDIGPNEALVFEVELLDIVK